HADYRRSLPGSIRFKLHLKCGKYPRAFLSSCVSQLAEPTVGSSSQEKQSADHARSIHATLDLEAALFVPCSCVRATKTQNAARHCSWPRTGACVASIRARWSCTRSDHSAGADAKRKEGPDRFAFCNRRGVRKRETGAR